jgi:hypothetical protein
MRGFVDKGLIFDQFVYIVLRITVGTFSAPLPIFC